MVYYNAQYNWVVFHPQQIPQPTRVAPFFREHHLDQSPMTPWFPPRLKNMPVASGSNPLEGSMILRDVASNEFPFHFRDDGFRVNSSVVDASFKGVDGLSNAKKIALKGVNSPPPKNV